MKILQVHNFYQQPGGEDQVFKAEADLLRACGHDVIQYSLNNKLINDLSKFQVLKKTFWNNDSYNNINSIIQNAHPQICHIHNTYPLISPSVYYACQKNHIPVVQTLHNYRLLCPAATLFREGKVCEDCSDKFFPWPGIWHGCYHGSHLHSSLVASLLATHKILGTWSRQIDCFIALTEFARSKFVQAGLPAEKIIVNANFLAPDPGKKIKFGEFALFVGRLSPEKGLWTLINAWREIPEIPLKIIGDGPLFDELHEKVISHIKGQVEFLGRLSHDQVLDKMKKARVLIFPSEWYEPFGLSIIEAYACGLPVIGSRLGSMQNLILNGKTGLLFEPGNPETLAKNVMGLWNNEEKIMEMGKAASYEYEQKYTADHKYQSLITIYEKTITEYRTK